MKLLVSGFCLVLGIVLLNGCNSKKKSTKYSLVAGYSNFHIPDSNKQKYAEFVQKTVAAATSNNPSLKDQDDVIEAAEEIADKLYGIRENEMELCEVYSDESCYEVNEMTIEKMKIKDSLKMFYGIN